MNLSIDNCCFCLNTNRGKHGCSKSYVHRLLVKKRVGTVDNNSQDWDATGDLCHDSGTKYLIFFVNMVLLQASMRLFIWQRHLSTHIPNCIQLALLLCSFLNCNISRLLGVHLNGRIVVREEKNPSIQWWCCKPYLHKLMGSQILLCFAWGGLP